MKGAEHWPERADHEHVHCEHCNANGVHVRPLNPDDGCGPVVYAVHNRKGMDLVCDRSRGRVVPAKHRHQGDPR